MSAIRNTGYPLVAPIVPYDVRDTFPTHLPKFGLGGLRTEIGLNSLNLIPYDRQVSGMIAYVIDNNTGEYYKLINPRNPYTQSNDWNLIRQLSETGWQAMLQGAYVTSLNYLQGIVHIDGRSGIKHYLEGQNIVLTLDETGYLNNIYYSINNPSGFIDSSSLIPYLTISQANLDYYPLLSNPSGYVSESSLTGTFVMRIETGGFASMSWANDQFYLKSNPDNYITNLQGSGMFYPLFDNPSGYIKTIDLSGYVPRSETGNLVDINLGAILYYPRNSNPDNFISTGSADLRYYPMEGNPSGFLTTVSLSQYVPRSETGDLVSTTLGATLYYPRYSNPDSFISTGGADLRYYPLEGNPSGFLTNASISGDFVPRSETGELISTGFAASYYYPISNPSGYISTGSIIGVGYIHVINSGNNTFVVSGDDIKRIEEFITYPNTFETGDCVCFSYDSNTSTYKYKKALASGTYDNAYAVGVIEECTANDFRIIYQGRTKKIYNGSLSSGQVHFLSYNQAGKLLSAPPPPITNYWKKPMIVATSYDDGIVLAGQPILSTLTTYDDLTGFFYPLQSNPSGYATTEQLTGSYVYDYMSVLIAKVKTSQLYTLDLSAPYDYDIIDFYANTRTNSCDINLFIYGDAFNYNNAKTGILPSNTTVTANTSNYQLMNTGIKMNCGLVLLATGVDVNNPPTNLEVRIKTRHFLT